MSVFNKPNLADQRGSFNLFLIQSRILGANVCPDLWLTPFPNARHLITEAQLRPHIEDAKISGFKISHLQDDSFFKIIGLEVGDVLYRMNKIGLSNPLDGLRLIQELQTAKDFEIEFGRNGSRQILSCRESPPDAAKVVAGKTCERFSCSQGPLADR